VIGQEPDQLRPGYTFDTYQRIPGNNIRNFGSIVLDAQVTKVFGLELAYDNTYWNYEQQGETLVASAVPGLFTVSPSLSGVLDRIEHNIRLDGKWLMQPETVGVVGYQYHQNNYIGNEVISGTFDGAGNAVTPPPVYYSNVRNSRTHQGYLGVDHNFTPDLTGSVRLGAQNIRYYNDPTDNTQTVPYTQDSLRYMYNQNCYFELGVSYGLAVTDVINPNPNDNNRVTQSQLTGTVYGNLVHKILPRLTGAVQAQYQNSTLQGGATDGAVEQYYLVGLNLVYEFNRYFSANAGYNYDKLQSEIGRGFDRNRVYIGIGANY
jgi:hypothetical protein